VSYRRSREIGVNEYYIAIVFTAQIIALFGETLRLGLYMRAETLLTQN